MEAVPIRSARPLSVLLGRERQVLERLCWQLRVVLVLVASDRLAWAGPGLREADLLADRLGMLEFTRAIEVAGCSGPLGFDGEPTLEDLVARWPLPGRTVLRRHALHLRRLVREVCDRAEAVTGALADQPVDGAPLDALIRSGGLAVARRLPPPSLIDFVLTQPARR